MAEAIYLLCAITSLVCAALLVRSYVASRTALLLFSSLCFVGFAVNNVVLFLDLVIVPDIDLSAVRAYSALVAVVALLGGLIWSAKVTR